TAGSLSNVPRLGKKPSFHDSLGAMSAPITNRVSAARVSMIFDESAGPIWSAMRISTYSVAAAGWTNICAATAANDAPTAPNAGKAHCGASRVSSAVTIGLWTLGDGRGGHARREQQSTRRANSRSQPSGMQNQRWRIVPKRDQKERRRMESRQ